MVKFDPRSPLSQTRKIAVTAAVVASVGAFCIEFLPHTIFLNKYKKVVHVYRFMEEVPLHKDIGKLFNEVLDDLNVSTKKRELYKPFTVVGFDVQYAGLPESRFGSIIGIPMNYTYKDELSLRASELRLINSNGEPLNLYHPAAEDLIETLLLSDKAKKFGIAREVLMAQKEMPLYRMIESPVLMSLSIVMAEFTRDNYKLVNKPLICLVYGASALMGFFMWFNIRDTLNTYFEACVDKELSELGPEYVEGGKEFYEKLVKRNVAIRTLLGAEGAKKFNKDGDEIFFFRQKSTPITQRKKLFTEITFQNSEQEAA